MAMAWESVFNQIRRLDIVTPQGMSGTLARESRLCLIMRQVLKKVRFLWSCRFVKKVMPVVI